MGEPINTWIKLLLRTSQPLGYFWKTCCNTLETLLGAVHIISSDVCSDVHQLCICRYAQTLAHTHIKSLCAEHTIIGCNYYSPNPSSQSRTCPRTHPFWCWGLLCSFTDLQMSPSRGKMFCCWFLAAICSHVSVKGVLTEAHPCPLAQMGGGSGHFFSD